MEIKTKYEVGDRCYTILDNELYEVEITRILADVIITGDVSRICYYVKVWDERDGKVEYKEVIDERDLFATTADLIENLINKTHPLYGFCEEDTVDGDVCLLKKK